MRCLSFDDGREIWRFAYPVKVKRNHGMSRTVPAVTDRYVVGLGPKCHVTCLDAVTGRREVDDRPRARLRHDGPPVVRRAVPAHRRRARDPRAGRPRRPDARRRARDRRGRVDDAEPDRVVHDARLDRAGRPRRRPDLRVLRQAAAWSASPPRRASVLWHTDAWKIGIATVPTPVPVGDDRVFFSGGYNAGSLMMRDRARRRRDARAARACTASDPRCSAPRSRRRSSTRVTSTASVRTGSSSACASTAASRGRAAHGSRSGCVRSSSPTTCSTSSTTTDTCRWCGPCPERLRTPGPRRVLEGPRRLGAPGPGRRTPDRPGPHAHGLPGGRDAVNHAGQTSAPPDRHLLGRWTPWIVVLVLAAVCGAILTASSQTGRDREPAGLDPALRLRRGALPGHPARADRLPGGRARSRRGSSRRPPSPSGPPTRSWSGATSECSSSRPTAPGATRRSRSPDRRSCLAVSADGRPVRRPRSASSCAGRSRVRSSAGSPSPARRRASPRSPSTARPSSWPTRARVRSGTSPRTAVASAASAIATRSATSPASACRARTSTCSSRPTASCASSTPAATRSRPSRRDGRPGARPGASRPSPSRASAAAATRRTSPCSPTGAS